VGDDRATGQHPLRAAGLHFTAVKPDTAPRARAPALLHSLSWWKFIFVFFTVYMVMFTVFAFIYWAFPTSCMVGVDGR
jgi:hypothetical protein